MATTVTSQLNTYRIADFLEWAEKKQLILNPDFQRNKVWTEPAKVYLIDSILRQVSLPKFYIRTRIDLATRRTLREVVDGQQRLSAILDFADDKITLTKRAGEFKGYRYSTLPQDLQEIFLNYNLAVEQLVNASDSDVLEVFARLNSYGTTLNSAEKRHAEYQGPLKWSVRDASKENSDFFEKFKIVGTQQRLRMADDALIAELYGVLMEGIRDGGEAYLNGLYRRYDENFPNQKEFETRLQKCIDEIAVRYPDTLFSPLGRRPQFVMLFAAVAHSLYGIPKGSLSVLPPRRKLAKNDRASLGLARLAQAIETTDEDLLSEELRKFRTASRSTTHRIASRRVRFPQIYKAISGD